VKNLIFPLLVLTLSLILSGCGRIGEAEKEAANPVLPTPVPSRPLSDNASIDPSRSPERYETNLVKDESFTQSITPESSSFSIPLYPDATLISGKKAQGMTPQEKAMIQSTMEMYSLDSIDEIIRFYRASRKGLSIREFQTDRGRNVTISDIPELVPQPFCSRATTLVLYRENKDGRTRMIYTGFRLKE